MSSRVRRAATKHTASSTAPTWAVPTLSVTCLIRLRLRTWADAIAVSNNHTPRPTRLLALVDPAEQLAVSAGGSQPHVVPAAVLAATGLPCSPTGGDIAARWRLLN